MHAIQENISESFLLKNNTVTVEKKKQMGLLPLVRCREKLVAEELTSLWGP